MPAVGEPGDDPVANPGDAPRKPISFLDLPPETQLGIFEHCTHADLICLALVSKHFHELASSLIYRNFHIIFPDDDDVSFDSPIDGLAHGLDTFTTSEYNYAKHLREVCMDTLSTGPRGENSYQSYLYSSSCGKFLNTLLNLTLKRATTLETFRWNIRVEISRPVYQQLHRMTSLQKLHIRMQAGESYYINPPPLPGSLSAVVTPHTHNHWHDADVHHPFSPAPVPMVSLFGPPPTGPVPGGILPPGGAVGPPSALLPPSKASLKSKANKRKAFQLPPATLSGFKKLRSLNVLDIDDLDVIPELKRCVRNSASSLTELSLSFSENLASKARKPFSEPDPEESDVDDEFQVVPASASTLYDSTGPAKAFRAQEERKFQETILSRILDVAEQFTGKKPGSNDESLDEEKHRVGDDDHVDDPARDHGEDFVSSLRGASKKLMQLVHGSDDLTASHQEILDTIVKAAKKYVDSPEHAEVSTKAKEALLAQPTSRDGESSADGAEKASNVAATDGPAESESKKSDSVDHDEKTPTAETMQSGRAKKKGVGQDLLPEDIDIEHMEPTEENQDETEEQALDDKSTQGPAEDPTKVVKSSETTLQDTTGTGPPGGNAPLQLKDWLELNEGHAKEAENVSELCFTVENKVLALQSQFAELNAFEHEADVNELMLQMAGLKTVVRDVWQRIKDAKKSVSEGRKPDELVSKDLVKSHLSDYVHDTRGFALESLSIHLIPVKPSVLSKALNLGCLKQLTLLNVGNQAPIWSWLTKENRESPLALRSVFTDNVSKAFLTCMSQLSELHEMFLLERGTKHKPESLAPRGNTTIDQIRRLVLKKHISTLKRLMIKDESNATQWDVNEKTMILLCSHGLKLEELAISMNIHAVHAFMQYFSSMINLRALHILRFKNNDTCIWVMREILRFIVDNLSHNPSLKLEWIAMEDDRVDRVVRPSEDEASELASEEKEEGEKKKSKKGKESLPGYWSSLPILPTPEEDDSSSDSDSEEESGSRLKVQTVGPLQFYDVWEVKIFEKEIRTGRL